MLNKHNLTIARLASKDRSRSTMDAINIRKDCTEVTDGHLLMRVAVPDLKADSFPCPTSPNGTQLAVTNDYAPFRMSAESALAVEKVLPKRASMPILACAAIGMDADGSRSLIANDLETITIKPAKIDGSFPDCDSVMPDMKDYDLAVSFDARKLKKILDVLCLMGDRGTKYKDQPITVQLHLKRGNGKGGEKNSQTRAMVLQSKTCEKQDVTSLLMPIRP